MCRNSCFPLAINVVFKAAFCLSPAIQNECRQITQLYRFSQSTASCRKKNRDKKTGISLSRLHGSIRNGRSLSRRFAPFWRRFPAVPGIWCGSAGETAFLIGFRFISGLLPLTAGRAVWFFAPALSIGRRSILKSVRQYHPAY